MLKSQRNETLTRPRVKALAGQVMISKAPQDLIHQVLTAQSSRLKRVLTIQQMNRQEGSDYTTDESSRGF